MIILINKMLVFESLDLENSLFNFTFHLLLLAGQFGALLIEQVIVVCFHDFKDFFKWRTLIWWWWQASNDQFTNPANDWIRKLWEDSNWCVFQTELWVNFANDEDQCNTKWVKYSSDSKSILKYKHSYHSNLVISFYSHTFL